MNSRLWSVVAILIVITGVSSASAPPAHAPAAHAPSSAAGVLPDDALKRLVEGNERFVTEMMKHPNGNTARRCETFADGQHPFATILSCADSRAPVELLFDQGIGDLFVVRVAGNVADVDEIGTIEYGAEHLGSQLIVVLGHTKCGAVTAVVKEAKVSKNIAQLVDNIVPAVATAKKNVPGAQGETLINASIDANVFQSVQDLITHSDELNHMVAAGKVKIVGAVYDIHAGTVRWLGEHPRQAQLLSGAPVTHKGELLHTPAKKGAAPHSDAKHEAPSKNDHDAANHAPAKKDSHADASHEPSASAEGPQMPHQSGTLKGLMIPATFLGGAGLASGVMFHVMKSRTTTVPTLAEMEAAPEKH